ncbi:MAG: heavy-metal-associated domain-containing protein [Flavobacteriales bacterium]|nr:heavy-metal-associated domain-containing protein [Flavobacteriales bacterium]
MKETIKTAAITIAMLFIAVIGTTSTIKAQETSEKTYIKIAVDGLSCPFCAYGLEKKLKEVSGSKNISIELTEGEATMSVPIGQQPTEEELRKIVNDAGFTAKDIAFSETPFETKKDE